MKLSKAQDDVMNYLKMKIDEARRYDTYLDYRIALAEKRTEFMRERIAEGIGDAEWWNECIRREFEEARDEALNKKKYIDYWEQEREGISLCIANSRTIKKLESMGLIEIINDGGSCADIIKVLNY